MQNKGLDTCARQLSAEVKTVKSLDVVLAVCTADSTTELHLPTVAELLGVTLRERQCQRLF